MSFPELETTAPARPGSARRRSSRRLRGVGLLALACLVIYLVPLVFTSDYNLRVATLICMYGTMALGWNLLGGFANQVSLGHAVFVAIGAYTCVLFQVKLDLTPWVALPAGAVASAAVAVVIGIPTLRLSGHYFALATLALLEIALILAKYFGWTGGASGMSMPILPSGWGNLQFDEASTYFYLAGGMLLVALGISYLVHHSRLGLRLFGIRENPDAAALAGVNLFRTKMVTFVISAMVTSMAGTFYMIFIQFIDPDSGFSLDLSINMVIYAIVGGVTVWWGPALGALLLVPLLQYTSLRLTDNLAPVGPVIYGVLLIALIIVQPRGIGAWLVTAWKKVVKHRGPVRG